MTSKERVRLAFLHQEADRVPVVEQVICSKVASELMGRPMHTGGGALQREVARNCIRGESALRDFKARVVEDVVALNRQVGLDLARVPDLTTAPHVKELSAQEYLFEYGPDLWEIHRYVPATDVFHCVDSAIAGEGMSALERFVAHLEAQEAEAGAMDAGLDQHRLLLRELGTEKAVAIPGNLGVPMEKTWLEALVLRPDLIDSYLDTQVRRIARYVQTLVPLGAAVVWGGWDLASNHGPIYSPRHVRRYLLPRLQRVTASCHELGVPYVFRTDGWTWPIADELFVKSGVDGYGEIDIQAGMDLLEIKQRLPHLTLWGGVDCAGVLVSGSPADVVEVTQRCIDNLATGGGYLLGSSNAIHSGVPTANLMAMMETALAHRFACHTGGVS